MLIKETTSALEIATQLAADFATRAGDADKRGELPAEDIQALKDSKYLALTIPQEYGGFGLSMRETVAAHLELAQGSTSTALVASMTLHIFAHMRETRAWSAAHYERFCRAVVEEGAVFNSIASEPRLGSPSRGALFATTAVAEPDGSGWRINGHKNWATGGTHLTHLLVSLSLQDEEPAVILVPNHAPGVTWEATWRDALSLRASDSHDVYFKDVVVPPDHLVERRDSSLRKVPNGWFPMLASATYLGAAVAARNDIIKYALERVPTALGKPIATLPNIQRQIGELDIQLQAARAYLFATAADWRDGDNRAEMMPRITATKQFVMNMAIDSAERALRIAGGAGMSSALPFERYFRDSRGGLSHPPMGDAALEFVGRHAIEGLEAEYKSESHA